LLGAPASAQVLDGDGSEHPLAVDDSADGKLMMLRAKAYTDGLWLGLEFDRPVEVDSGSGLVVHANVDGDLKTGDQHGCELVFDMRARHGTVHTDLEVPGRGRLHEKLGVKVAPAFESTTAEIQIPRMIRGGHSLYMNPGVGIFIEFEGDRVPDEGFLELQWSPDFVEFDPIPIERHEGAFLRVVAWNIEQDGLFDPDRMEAQSKMIRALDPDVLVVSESFNHSAEKVFAQVETLDLFDHAVKADPGNVVLSRHPISGSWPISSLPDDRNGYRASAVMIDAPDGEFLVLPQHWRCCDKGEGARLFEADSLIGFLKDAFTPKGNFSFESEPPFLVIGDLNLVVTRRPLDVALTGIVIDKDSYGPDFPPGPDRTPLTVVPMRHAEAPFTYTWHSSGTKYYSARLDWALVPSSVEVLRSFVFDTGTMFGATLQELGLSRRDARVASDHMPIVVDVRW
jgi:endonuclease/exonuclease/phosphatase family metal-dependent hydrolase